MLPARCARCATGGRRDRRQARQSVRVSDVRVDALRAALAPGASCRPASHMPVAPAQVRRPGRSTEPRRVRAGSAAAAARSAPSARSVHGPAAPSCASYVACGAGCTPDAPGAAALPRATGWMWRPSRALTATSNPASLLAGSAGRRRPFARHARSCPGATARWSVSAGASAGGTAPQ